MFNKRSPLSYLTDEDLINGKGDYLDLRDEIILFRKALQYCYDQRGDDKCWMDYRHMLMRFLPGYIPRRDDVTDEPLQLEHCKDFIKCWQENQDWFCLGGDKGKTIKARSIGTFDCLEGD